MKIRNAHPNVVVLVDHHAIEEHFMIPTAAEDMLHRYDPHD